MEPQGPQHRRFRWSAPAERLGIQAMHLGTILLVCIFIFVLALYGELDHASVTALYGGVLGHLGTSASQRFSSRATDLESTVRSSDAHRQTPSR